MPPPVPTVGNEPQHEHSLSFLATLAFALGFFGARAFHTEFPNVMIITTTGIHFHHFWYGLAMIIISGWLGIAANGERRNRVYAVIFGLGVGFVGDEVGLLLTFGDYYSELTFDFFVAAVAFILLVTLLVRYFSEIERDVLRVGITERATHVGIFVAGFSALFFAVEMYALAVAVLGAGCFLALWGFFARRRIKKAAAAGP